MNIRYHLLIISIIVLGAGIAWAGTTGKIAGVVTDAKTGEQMIGASIVIEGTTMGAATNVSGYYVILNIPPGTYTLVASAVGYTRTAIKDVQVSIDLTSTVDIKLNPTVVEVGEEVVVTAERQLIRKDLTAKTAVVSTEQIASLPVTEVSEVLNLQAGYVEGSLRGGRQGEVAYWVDGVPVTDVYDGTPVVQVNKNLVQELQLVSGAFNAEYGQALSGIVNVATKEGGARYTGSVGTYLGDYLSWHNDIFPGIEDRSATAIRNFEGNISGPVIGEDLTFFANARYIYFNGWLKGVRKFNPWNIARYDSTGSTVIGINRDPGGLGDNSIVPMNWSKRWYAQGKLTWHASPVVKVSANYIYDNNPYKSPSGDNVRNYFYDPDGLATQYNLSNTVIFQLSHTLSSSTFYTIGASWFDKQYKSYAYEDPHDPRYTHPNLFTPVDSYSMFTGGTDLSRFRRNTRTMLGKVDLTSQLDQTHLVKVGVEVRKHKMTYEDYNLIPIQSQQAFDPRSSDPFIITQIPPISADISVQRGTYDHRPLEASAYIQDKMEFKDFILNIGLRFDYFQPDGVVLADETDPNIYDPIKSANRANSLDVRRTYWYKKATAKTQLSPRIGASFPITDRGVVHFSYGHFFQIPRFERLYENPDFRLAKGNGNVGLVGNADLKPEQTINGEIGVQQQLSDDIAVDLTAYLRDIRNLTTTGTDEIQVSSAVKYSKYQNKDFGTIKGIILTLTKRFAGGFSATLDYTYQVARGSGSDPTQARNALLGGAQPDVQLLPLNWDQRQTLNITATYTGTHWGASAIASYGSGTPYTPRATQDISTLLTNSQLKPSTNNVDIRTYYEIPIEWLRLVAFVRVFNVFDVKNETGVFDDSGQADYTINYTNAINSNTKQLVNTIAEWFRRPDYYSEPRRVEFGVNLEF